MGVCYLFVLEFGTEQSLEGSLRLALFSRAFAVGSSLQETGDAVIIPALPGRNRRGLGLPSRQGQLDLVGTQIDNRQLRRLALAVDQLHVSEIKLSVTNPRRQLDRPF